MIGINRVLKIETAHQNDSRAILDLQKLVYISEAAIYNDYSIPPLKQTPEEIQDQFETHRFLKATINNKIVGSVRARNTRDICSIGRLIVYPQHQNRGIGTSLMKRIEELLPSNRYVLFTGHKSERNLYLYNKLGYREYRRKKVNQKLTLVFLEKRIKSE
jgi:ribosomal protein S18 acetylase RimI-like enzyme